MISRHFFLLLGFLFLSQSTQAQQLISAQNFSKQKTLFEENRGQVADKNGKLCPEIKYIYSAPGFALILKTNSFSFSFSAVQDEDKPQSAPGAESKQEAGGLQPADFMQVHEPVNILTHRVDISLPGANPHPVIIPESRSESYNNYYLAYTPEQGIQRVYSYAKITYKNLYPNIDFVFLANEEGKIKYDIIVHPGGRASDIKMLYQGMSDLSLENGKLITKTTLGKIEESIPQSYILETGDPVQASYNLSGNAIFLNSPVLESQTLVIDPEVLWGSYYGDGGGISETLSGVAAKGGAVYFTGYTETKKGITSTGAYQDTLAGYEDAFLVKFNDLGKRVWGTYYGGSKTEYASGIVLAPDGSPVICGITYSSSGISTAGAFQNALNAASDGYIAKFDSYGGRKWATYVGGDSLDAIVSMALNSSGNIYAVGATFSSTGIATPGSYQPALGGMIDGFIIKLDGAGNREWATYLGGSKEDAIRDITLDNNGDFYICGGIWSFGLASSGAYQPSKNAINGPDGYVARFNSKGERQWATYYGGSINTDFTSVNIDAYGDLYLFGGTASKAGIATASAYQTSIASNFDCCLIKMTNSGQLLWGTYYGGEKYNDPIAMSTDKFGNVYIGGNTKSTTGIASPGSYKSKLEPNGDNIDCFLAKFNKLGQRQWGTYFGGKDKVSGEWDILQDLVSTPNGSIYLTGRTYSSENIATPGTHEPTYKGGYSEGFIVKFRGSYVDAGVSAISSTIVCEGQADNTIRIKNYGEAPIDSVQIEWSVDDINQTPLLWKENIAAGSLSSDISLSLSGLNGGTHTLKIWTSNPNGYSDDDKANDTLSVSVEVNPSPQVNFTAKAGCLDMPVEFLNFTSISSGSISQFHWNFGDGFISSSASPLHSYDTAGTYLVTLTATSDKGCVSTFSKSITINPLPVTSFIAKDSCQSIGIHFQNNSTIGRGNIAAYYWDFGDGDTSSDKNPSHFYAAAGLYQVKLETVSDKGCKSQNTQTIQVFNTKPPIANFEASNDCVGSPIKFGDKSKIDSGSIVAYMWEFGDGSISTDASPEHIYNQPGKFNVIQTVFSNKGCSDSSSHEVEIYSLPNASFTYKADNRTVRFVNEDTAVISYNWHFGDGDSSNIDNPVHKYKSEGKFVVRLKTVNQKGCSNESSDTIIIAGCSSASGGGWKVYPNPVISSSITLEGNDCAIARQVLLFDVLGRCILNLQGPFEGKTIIPLPSFASGIYYLKILNSNGESLALKLFSK